MPNILTIDSLEQLTPFANDKSLIEIVVREKNSRFKSFQKALIRNLSQTQEQTLVKDALATINKNHGIVVKNLDFIAQQGQLSLLVNGLNLCSSCAGFAILSDKLNKISEQIDQQIKQLSNELKQGNDIHASYKYNEVLANHTAMLDKHRLQQPYSEESLRELVDQEFNVLMLFIRYFKNGIVKDQDSFVFSIFSLLSMLTATLINFDEIYYENNHQTLSQLGDTVWYSSHDKWMNAYSMLLEKDFIEKLQDYAFLEKNMSLLDADVYYISLLDQVIYLRQEVETNQQLVVALSDAKLLHQVRECINTSTRESIDALFSNTSLFDNPEASNAYSSALQQVALS